MQLAEFLYYSTQLPSSKEFVPNSSGRQWVEGTLVVSCGDEDSGVKQGRPMEALHLLAPGFALELKTQAQNLSFDDARKGYVRAVE